MLASTLSACADGGLGGLGFAGNGSAGAKQGPHAVGVLLPLSGANAGLGHEMLSAVRIGLAAPGSPPLDVRDTSGPTGAIGAAQAALAAGDGMLVGPLTSADTAQISSIAQSGGIPVLSFTSDVAQAKAGVWVLGITPQQQVDRLVTAAVAEGRRQFAAFLPNSPLGRALGDALARACSTAGLPPPQVAYHAPGAGAVAQGLASLSAYDSRVAAAKGQGDAAGTGSPLPPDLAAALQSTPQASAPVAAPKPLDGPTDMQPAAAPKPAVTATAADPNAPPAAIGAPPFDALLLGDTGLELQTVIDALGANQVTQDKVRILGPGLWSAFAGKLGALHGAWYTAPDPVSRQAFVQKFLAQMHHVPKPLADLSYDAASLAGATFQGSGGGYPVSVLTRPEGFPGVDGTILLLPDGQTQRQLAVFEVQPGGGSRVLIPGSGKPVMPGSS